ncbi:ABC transporter ATP-binding protein [Desulfovulcanus ferrireducens]|uniref:ABC transporter ATP-binding protein n=1 Tax=Desulfovulcanus ferrireducens TaxID=2831190 RepID=UPI00207BC312|nr:ABC transporter ATP-binding protein [Desulfovulcanus ferrireducens]
MALIEVKDLDVSYGDVQVLWDINLKIEKGSIVALVGSNGAGKTTFLKTLSGLLSYQKGDIIYNGESLKGLPSDEIVKRGIIHVPEGRRLFPEMTVEENLLMGAYHRKKDPEIPKDLEHVYTLFPRLKERRKQKAGSLSGGEQQMVAMARGLMGRPTVFLVDEMSLGLAPLIVDNLIEIVHSINKEGNTVLLVEQDVQLALENSHYAYVLDTGRIAMEGKSEALLTNPEIKKIYLGM